MDIVVHGRGVEVPDHYRTHVSEKLERLGRYDSKLMNVDVELSHEKNRRADDITQRVERVEITVKTKGPVIRSEALAADFYSALETAITKLERQMRRAADRRRVHHGRNKPMSVHDASAQAEAQSEIERLVAEYDAKNAGREVEEDNLPGRIVREKSHPGVPMTVDQALENMELVGHDFYLFKCAETGMPTVVYRRRAYDYGLLRLEPEGSNGVPQGSAATSAVAGS